MSSSPISHPGQTVVAIPVCNEAERIVPCLLALSRQTGCGPFRVLLLINNTTDGTTAVVRGLQPRLGIPVHAVEHDFPPHLRSAGQARRLAMDHAAAMAGEAGVLLCTDADSAVPPDWVARNLFHLRQGADAVAGQAIIDPADAALIPAALHEADAAECAYAALLDEIDHRLDPDPADPWPRHAEHSGASIAVTMAAFRAAGGIPAVRSGEDRAFFAALRRIDARIRHAPDLAVVVSGRTVGRAEGGMADTIRRRMVQLDAELDDTLEPALHRARRALLRVRLRRAFQAGQDVGLAAASLGIQGAGAASGYASFGAAWEALEASSPALARRRVTVDGLDREMRRARAILRAVRPAMSPQMAVAR